MKLIDAIVVMLLVLISAGWPADCLAAEQAPGWLDTDEVQAIEAGSGFGMARAAEASGLPGPKHVLEFAEELELSAAQVGQMKALVAQMHAAAVAQGQQVLAAEAAVDAELARPVPDVTRLAQLTDAAGLARGRLRQVHLRTHLQAAPLLSTAQRARYRQLRTGGP